ncbi:MAG: hypothetical protein JW760_01340 [Spirochaetales bacterium]|nr:hypothetical protein [Spirochaetales bacterium]
MKTTLNVPDDILSTAKIKAAVEHTTLTALLVEGLELRMKQGGILRELPVSTAAGGLKSGYTWERLGRDGEAGGYYR